MTRKRKCSSGDRTGDPYRYLQGIPRQERVKSPYAIVREGMIFEQVFRTVKLVHIETGEVIYNQSL